MELKPLDGKLLERIATNGDATFKETTLNVIKGILEPIIPAEALEPTNRILARRKHRQLTLDDIVRIAYIHGRSIRENDGASPYSRILKYGEANGISWHNQHVLYATETLILIGFMEQTQEEDRKRHLCRKYAINPKVQEALSSIPPLR